MVIRSLYDRILSILFLSKVFNNVDKVLKMFIKQRRFTPEFINNVDREDIFVFGSNAAGNHYGGAARTAFMEFGARWGQGEGLAGNSYALPTLDENLKPLSLDRIAEAFVKLFKTALLNSEFTFYLTKVGIGIAGFKVEEICYSIKLALQKLNIFIPTNIIIPREFYDCLTNVYKIKF